MAGLGLFFQKGARARAPRGLLRSAYDFFVLNLFKMLQGVMECPRAVSTYTRSYAQKTFFGPPSEALMMPFSIQKPVKNHFCRLTIQEPIFSVSNTEFEGGDGHGHGDCDCTFLVKQAQPSHNGCVTAMAVGQRQRPYCVRTLTGNYLSSTPRALHMRGVQLELKTLVHGWVGPIWPKKKKMPHTATTPISQPPSKSVLATEKWALELPAGES
jgi:hypothetical protein